MKKKSEKQEKEKCGLAIFVDNECSSNMIGNQTKLFILKKNNEDSTLLSKVLKYNLLNPIN